MVKDIDTLYGKMVRATNRYMGSVKLPGKLTLEKAKKLETIRIKTYDRVISEELKKIPKEFPDFDRLHPFHLSLVEVFAPLDRIRSEIGRIRAILRILANIRDDALYRISTAKSIPEVKKVRQMYLGRVWDVLKKNKDLFDFLIKLKKVVRKLPKVRFDEKTIVLAGFPNAGKSTLLKALTGSEPEIAPYPFTTKDIMIGHFEHQWRKYQVVDTPGILDRSVEEMNEVERKAVSALAHLADAVIFLFDPFQDVEMQRDLLTKVSKIIRAPIVTAVNKADLLEDVSKARGEFGADIVISAVTGFGVEELRRAVLEKMG